MKNDIRAAGYRVRGGLRTVLSVLQHYPDPRFRYLLHLSCPGSGPEPDPAPQAELKDRIERAIGWFLYHQSLQPDGGITGTVFFRHGRLCIGGSYPEVTGYIIPTLFDHASLCRQPRVFEAAVRAAEFELPLQHADGWFPGGIIPDLSGPSVFNTGQIVHGLTRAYRETGNERNLRAALAACRWICRVQDEDGGWGRFNFLGMKRVYDTKVCEALLEVDSLQGTAEFHGAVDRHLAFVRVRQQSNGWFADCDNSRERNHEPLTHEIGYTIQGLLASYLILKRKEYLDVARSAADALLATFERTGTLPAGRYTSEWNPAVRSSCITGDAQISLCWMDLHRITGEGKYLQGALRLNSLLKRLQLRCDDPLFRGAVPSSCPAGGDYFPFSLTSWTVKYFTDALIEEFRITAHQ